MRARNFNIDSLAVSKTDREDVSRMTITLHGGRRRGRAGGQAALPAHRRPQGPGRHGRADRRARAGVGQDPGDESNRDEILRFVELSRGRVVDLVEGSVIAR
jgi:acetolactate synthase small subunit